MQHQKVIWFGIAFSTVIYAIIAYVMNGQPQQPFDRSARHPVALVMYLAALSAFAAGLIVPRVLQRAPSQTRMVLSLAVFESCAIFGFIASFVAQDWRLYLPAWAVAVMGFARVWPSDEISAPGSSRTSL